MQKYDVGAYIWPAYTGDEPRTRIFWPEGMGEWETVRAAKPKFEGHLWPRKPLWGYVNEADPAVMEMEIEQATSHGVNVFIYDWYWYDRRPFLECCLNDGFLKARNNSKMKFMLMWANHDANYYWDRRLASTEYRKTTLWSAKVNRAEFEAMATRAADKYFRVENYYKIDGKPVFQIYELANFIAGFGSIEKAKEALDWFRQYVTSLGFPGLHLQFIVRSNKALDLSEVDGSSVASYGDTTHALGGDSITHYQYGQMTDITGDYLNTLERIAEVYKKIDEEFHVPYYPHVSVGWDNNPRSPHRFMPRISTNNGPENFEIGLRMAKDYVDKHDLPCPLITVNTGMDIWKL